ncbi:pyridine nucleotide-disulfide oxidoreductase [Pseudomonas synxantha BG33R]|uniref:FAD-dependent oxidoreductase n=1 Tax=Pseudomonas synxantha TaxID=47883 RepID=UPI00025FDC9A|nr:FAD-dependent oxidoreductase [Pseudomonas synxantha]EIK73140.1 pyridine nucleotide-disulfide oxidoreductase [Pseudomonas synxantha BG33R]
MNRQRRLLLKWLATGIGASSIQTLATPMGHVTASSYAVVVIVGGFAGATFARTLRRLDSSVGITLVEPSPQYHCCPLGVEYLVGKRDEETLIFGYAQLRAEGIEVVHQRARSIDAKRKQVILVDGSVLGYDRCVVATGIGYKYESIAGYSEAVARRVPHAWGGGEQLRLLRQQLEAMPNGGNVLISVPVDDYRCPPGPYERASLIADYLKTHKPDSRVIILDAKPRFAKQAQFEQAWKRFYGYGSEQANIQWIGALQGGTVQGFDEAKGQLLTEGGPVSGQVINIIAPQQADDFSRCNGLAAEHGWCPVNTQTLESLLVPDVHVIGDAAYAEKLPKSAFAATCQARVCALAIHSQMHGLALLKPQYMNVCYSLCADNYGISVLLHYQHDATRNLIEIQTLRVTPLDANDEDYRREALSAYSMFDSLVKEAFG